MESVFSDDGRTQLMVKRFRQAPHVQDAFRAEIQGLVCLRSIVGDNEILGWTVRVPEILRAVEDPPTLIMTRVPGIPLDELLRRGWDPTPTVSAVYAHVLMRYWETTGRPIGDVNLENLLCDPVSNEMGFVDPGMPNDAFEIAEHSRTFYPASRDLGCLLHQIVSTNVRRLIAGDRSGARRARFVRRVISACVLHTGHRAEFLTEIGRCSAAHLRRVSGGNILESAWKLAVRRLGSRALVRELKLIEDEIL